MSLNEIAVPPNTPFPKLSREYPTVGRATKSGEKRMWYLYSLNCEESGSLSAPLSRVAATFTTGSVRSEESGSAPDFRKVVPER